MAVIPRHLQMEAVHLIAGCAECSCIMVIERSGDRAMRRPGYRPGGCAVGLTSTIGHITVDENVLSALLNK